MPNNTCNICLENVVRPAKLNLTCECKYYVHYKCFNTWHQNNKQCIICHKFCYKPDKYKRNQTPIRRTRVIKKRNFVEYRQNNRRTYPIQTRYIQDNLTFPRCCCSGFYQIPPEKIENYCKGVVGLCFVGIGIWIYINNGII